MASISTFWSSIWKGKAEPPTAVELDSTHVDGQLLGAEIKAHHGYFQLNVNELYLEHSRKWLVQIAPMVVAISEFTYAGNTQTVPFVVGPSRLKTLGGVAEPAGMLYHDTRVAGLHPYKGGTVSFAIILCQVPIDNIGNRFLSVIEETAGSFEFATTLTPYLKIANAVSAGITNLLALNTTVPLLGWKQSFDRAGLRPLAPGYSALISAPNVPKDKLWVKERRLCYGDSLERAKPYRASDFVLFSVTQPPDARRDDVTELSFGPLWQRVLEEARVTTPEGIKSLNANFATLSQAILTSPDLIESQADALVTEYYDRVGKIREAARGQTFRSGLRGPGSTPSASPDGISDEVRRRSLRAFDA